MPLNWGAQSKRTVSQSPQPFTFSPSYTGRRVVITCIEGCRYAIDSTPCRHMKLVGQQIVGSAERALSKNPVKRVKQAKSKEKEEDQFDFEY